MHIGFILTKTPSEEGFNIFLKLLSVYIGKEDISIYLIGNGVYTARDGSFRAPDILEILKKARVYASHDDLKARGIKVEQLIRGIEIFESYEILVLDMMEKMDQIISL
jgi:sulfur relay protein TusB/DsrH